MKISSRLTLWFGGILVVSLLVMSGVLYHEFDEVQKRAHNPDEEPEPAWQEAGEIVLYYGVPTVLLLLGGGWWLIRNALRPVTALTRSAERIHAHNLHERLLCSGSGDELDRLTQVINSMMARLDDSFTRSREFTLHASHELKTPLAILHGEIETLWNDPSSTPAHRESFASQLDEIQRLNRIVEGLTFLAKTDAGQVPLVHEPVRLEELVQDSFADAQMLARSQQIKVELAACEEVVMHGDSDRLRQLLLNLTDNAIKYNQPRGRVTISLVRDNGTADLTITNTGPGISLEKLPRVFDRFYRGDSAHNSEIEGCGLGLSIAQWIVNAHTGTIQIASDPETVTTVTVRIPTSNT